MIQPTRSYIICATPRCGSHLLAEALQTTGIGGRPDEYFHTNRYGQLQNKTGLIAELYGKRTLEEFRDMVLEFGSSENGVFGIILHWDSLPHIIDNYHSLPQYQNLNAAELFDDLFHNPKYIWIKRRDKVRQAISWVKAKQSDVWHSRKGSDSQPQLEESFEYDFFKLEVHYKRFIEAENGWSKFFKTHDIEPFVVVYEDLTQNFEQTALDLLDFLEIPYPDDLVFQERTLRKQANSLNEQWAAKYRRQMASPTHRFVRFLRYLRFKLLPF